MSLSSMEGERDLKDIFPKIHLFGPFKPTSNECFLYIVIVDCFIIFKLEIKGTIFNIS
uniref:Uncharacterized protein n=1 Tax=Rhizophora mucronata TaxID=61149 RepID=A0A2P2KQI9_RHIMU